MTVGLRRFLGLAEPTTVRGGDGWWHRAWAGAASGGRGGPRARRARRAGRRAGRTRPTRSSAGPHTCTPRPRTERVLVVTNDPYVRHQHCDAVRLLGGRYGCGIETIGYDDVTRRAWGRPLSTTELLQEVRSSLLAMQQPPRRRRPGAVASRRPGRPAARHGARLRRVPTPEEITRHDEAPPPTACRRGWGSTAPAATSAWSTPIRRGRGTSRLRGPGPPRVGGPRARRRARWLHVGARAAGQAGDRHRPHRRGRRGRGGVRAGPGTGRLPAGDPRAVVARAPLPGGRRPAVQPARLFAEGPGAGPAPDVPGLAARAYGHLALYRDCKLAAAAAANAAGEHVMEYNARKQSVIREIYDRAFRAAGLLPQR